MNLLSSNGAMYTPGTRLAFFFLAVPAVPLFLVLRMSLAAFREGNFLVGAAEVGFLLLTAVALLWTVWESKK
jgi:hypothetical protein